MSDEALELSDECNSVVEQTSCLGNTIKIGAVDVFELCAQVQRMERRIKALEEKYDVLLSKIV